MKTQIGDAPVIETVPAGDLLDAPLASESAIRGSALRTIAYFAGTLASAAVLPLLFRYLGVARSGQYVTVTSLITILAGIVEVGLTGVSLKLYGNAEASERRALMRTLLSMRLFTLGLAVTLVLGFALAAGYPSVIVLGLALGSLGVVLEGIGSTYNVWLAVHMQLGWIAVANVVRQLIAAGLTAVLVLEHASLLAIFAVFVPAGAAQTALSAWKVARTTSLTPSGDVRRCLALAWETAPYVIAMALGFLYFRVPVVAMSLLGTAQETGYFGSAFRLVETLTLMTIVLTAVVPILTRAAERDTARHLYGLRRMLEVSIFLGASLSIATVTGATLAIQVLAGPKFTPAVGPLRALAPLLLLRFINTTWGFGLLSVGRYRGLLVANLLALMTSAAVCCACVPALGVYGAVVGALAAELTLLVSYGVLIRRALPEASFPLSTAALTVAAGAVTSCLVLARLPAVVVPVLGCAVFGAALYLAREIPQEVLGPLGRGIGWARSALGAGAP